MNSKIFVVYLHILFFSSYEVEASENATLQDIHEEVKKFIDAKNQDQKQEDKTKMKATQVKNTSKYEYPFNLIKIPKTNTQINPIKVLDHHKANKTKETETDRHDQEPVSFSDFNVIGEKSQDSHEGHDHGFDFEHDVDHIIDSYFHQEEDKKSQTTDKQASSRSKKEQMYKKTGTLVFYEEVDHKNNNSDHNLPILNVYVKKDKSINIANQVNEAKLRKGITPVTEKQKKKENHLDVGSCGKSEAFVDSKHLIIDNPSPGTKPEITEVMRIKKTFRDSTEPEEAKELFATKNLLYNATSKQANSLLPDDLLDSELDDDTSDIIITNDNIHEVIHRNNYPYEKNNPLFTRAEYSPVNIHSNQNPQVQNRYYQNGRNWNNGIYNPYYPYTNYGKGSLLYIPPQAGYPQGYYTHIAKQNTKPSYYSKPTYGDNVDFIDPKVYFNENNLNRLKPDYSRSAPSFTYYYPFKNQFNGLWENKGKKYNIVSNYPKALNNAWSATGNYQGQPVGYNSYYNPSTHYEYQEIIRPDNYLDKIWRSWISTKIVLKDPKNKVNPLRNINKFM